MFEADMRERQEGRVEIKEFPYETVETAIKFCYEFDVDLNIWEDQLVLLLQFTDMYQIQDLKISFKFFCHIRNLNF